MFKDETQISELVRPEVRGSRVFESKETRNKYENPRFGSSKSTVILYFGRHGMIKWPLSVLLFCWCYLTIARRNIGRQLKRLVKVRESTSVFFMRPSEFTNSGPETETVLRPQFLPPHLEYFVEIMDEVGN